MTEQASRTVTEQAIFDTVIAWHCNIGCLIDPVVYPEATAFLEDGDVLDLYHSKHRVPTIVREHVGLLSRIQAARRNGCLSLVARDFGLQYHSTATPTTETLQ